MKKIKLFPEFPVVLHGGDYNPEQWREFPQVLDQDFELMDKASCNAFSVGIFSWSDIEIAQDVFEFGWLDDIFERCAKSGKKLFLATPSAAIPAWLGEAHPEIMKQTIENSSRQKWQGRQCGCLNSELLRERVTIINEKLAQRYCNHETLIGWHISNEYSNECFCERCINKFQDWIQKKYQTIEELNRCYWSSFWGHKFTAWSQVNPLDGSMPTAKLDWYRFTNDSLVQFFKSEINAVRKYSSKPVTTNMMGSYLPVDYWKLAEECDFISDDCYPTWYNDNTRESAYTYSMFHDIHYSMKKKPFIMLESCPGIPNYKPYVKLRRPEEFQREMLLALGHGADGTMYFQWRKGLGNCEQYHGAVVGHDNSDQTMTFKRVADYGKHLKSISEIVGTTRRSDVAMIFDWESRWALDNAYGFNHREQEDNQKLHYQALWEHNFDIAVINADEDFSGYKMVIAPMLFMFKGALLDKIKSFVSNGGIFISSYLSGYVDEHNLSFFGGNPGGAKGRDIFGVWSEDVDGLEPSDNQSLTWQGKSYSVHQFAEILHASKECVVAEYGSDFYQNTPAVTCKEYSNGGAAVFIGARTKLDFLIDFYGEMAKKAGVKAVAENVPWDIKVARRIDEENGYEYLFFTNLTRNVQSYKLAKKGFDMWNNCEVTTVEMPASGSALIRL